MSFYNGFTVVQRERANAWLALQFEAKLRERPKECDACGQTAGVIEAHSEDYAEPFGDHIGAFALCYPCHMIVHARTQAGTEWAGYRYYVRHGYRLREPYTTCNWARFKKQFLTNGLGWSDFTTTRQWEPTRALLDEIEQGLHRPRGINE